MSEFYVKPGDSVTFAKTVGETDIYLFAGITGDTLTYTIIEVDPGKRRSRGDIKVVNQRGELVAVAQHLMAWVKDKA